MALPRRRQGWIAERGACVKAIAEHFGGDLWATAGVQQGPFVGRFQDPGCMALGMCCKALLNTPAYSTPYVRDAARCTGPKGFVGWTCAASSDPHKCHGDQESINTCEKLAAWDRAGGRCNRGCVCTSC